MKVYTSYYYQIRFFEPNMLPISTAIWPPAWYGTKPHKDKRNVWNGIENKLLAPNYSCDGLCHGQPCAQSPEKCLFLLTYARQLDEIDFDQFLKNLEDVLTRANCDTAVFIVHEAFDNPCSERVPIQNWFKKHGIGCEEWHKD